MLRRKLTVVFLLYAFLMPGLALGQAKIYNAPPDVIAKIRDEGLKKSQVMDHLSYLTDVIGGRLTNSPNMKRSNEWTRDTLAKWGLQNAQLVAWGPFGRGWELKKFSAQISSPYAFPIIAYPKAWSPGTDKTAPQPAPDPKAKKGTPPPTPNSVVNAEVVYVEAPTEADLAKYKGQLKGKIVLVSQPREIKADFDGFGHRLSDTELLNMANSPDPASIQRPQQPQAQPQPGQPDPRLQAFITAANRAKFFMDEGVAVLVDNSRNGSGGTLFVQSASVAQPLPENATLQDILGRSRIQPYQKEGEARMLPQMTMASEDYNRLIRMIKAGEKLKMSVDIQVAYHDGDGMGYNTTAEIPGSDLKDELVMLGGHMDSWHAGTGATDDAAGCAVAMEAVRILQALGLKPRRTIRVALWSGEEQGLLGSNAYVAQQFGEMKGATGVSFLPGGTPGTLEKKPAYDKFSVYFNLDNGTGKIRGVYQQGNAAAGPIFRQWLMPFRDLGANTLTMQNTGGTDHLAFDRIGLPGFQFIQDEIEYDTRTHHSNQDVFDRIQADDMKQAATIMAAFIYQAAMMDEKFPRKAR